MPVKRTNCPGCGHDSNETIGHWEPNGDTVYVTVECDHCGDVYAEERTYHGPVTLDG